MSRLGEILKAVAIVAALICLFGIPWILDALGNYTYLLIIAFFIIAEVLATCFPAKVEEDEE